ncbi:hypothetical protein FOA52_011070 [Chlamydomonas sp. UWO 241]|nr:hypothetical protein FOA52_011070 [Chlamydomonas sp. UWO 241]
MVVETGLKPGNGLYAPGTTKRSTVSMYDSSRSAFQPQPDGPYEDPVVAQQGPPAAHDHFDASREIKLPAHMGMPLPVPSYKDHYPPKDIPPVDKGLSLDSGTMSFTARTEHNDQFYEKPRIARPADPLTYTHKPAPWTGHETSNQAHYKPFGFENSGAARRGEGRPATEPPALLPGEFSTTYRAQYVPKDAPGRAPTGAADPREVLPWMGGDSTYKGHFTEKAPSLVPVMPTAERAPYPFTGTTEYTSEFIPKDSLPLLPPLTGVRSKHGLQLPLPRRSLGVEFFHRGLSDRYFVLIPRHMDAPCSASQVFTTLHDNQEQACILVLYGDDPVASNNMLLGQFDVVNIPPAPKDVPRIEVKFHLSKEMVFTAEARDLDSGRHKLWQQSGEIIVLKQ